MAYPMQHRLLTFTGTIVGTDSWTFGIRLNNPTAPTQADVDGIAGICSTWFSNAQVGITAKLNYIKLAPVGVDGKYPAGEDSVQHDFAGGVAGGGGALIYPPQIAWALSFSTALSRGRASKGRIFLPPLAYQTALTGLIQPASVAAILPPTKVMLNGLANSAVGVPIVASKVGAGSWQTITGIRGGLVYDTQRRRRRSLLEGYQALAL